MVLTRRRALVAAVGGLAALPGCGFITGEEPARFAAEPATVSQGARSETDYEERSVSERVVTREFSAGGESRSVEVTNQLARYERRLDLGPLGSQRAAAFPVLASPEVEVLGEVFNPIADLSEREILDRFDSEYENLSVGEMVGSRTVTVLDTETEVEKYEGTADLAGSVVDVFVHVTKVQHEGDFVVVVAVYPQRFPDEESAVFTLLSGLQHTGS
ncbi:hypothetical protein BRD10_00970 [Halobacteriales archaeon SW_12_71_31]|nr:MAG: hypothetical protein BRD10_00970 [Halobacteriales archaeon SW_12_71_31]